MSKSDAMEHDLIERRLEQIRDIFLHQHPTGPTLALSRERDRLETRLDELEQQAGDYDDRDEAHARQ